MKPYNNIKSKNLAFLLFAAQLTTWLGGIFFFMSLFVILTAFSDMIYYPLKMMAVQSIGVSIVMIFMSGVMAAIVAFEENYRRRTEINIVNNASV